MFVKENPLSIDDYVVYHVGVDKPIEPSEPLPELPNIAPGQLVVIEGRSPIWRYGIALSKLHGSKAGAIACYDPRVGAVIVCSHNPSWKEGNVLDIDPLRVPESD